MTSEEILRRGADAYPRHIYFSPRLAAYHAILELRNFVTRTFVVSDEPTLREDTLFRSDCQETRTVVLARHVLWHARSVESEPRHV